MHVIQGVLELSIVDVTQNARNWGRLCYTNIERIFFRTLTVNTALLILTSHQFRRDDIITNLLIHIFLLAAACRKAASTLFLG